MTVTATTNARTNAEREAMLVQVQRAIGAEMLRARIPERHREDVEQDLQLAVWGVTEKFEPNRGVKWSTYAISVIKTTLKNWNSRHRHEEFGTVGTQSNEFFDSLPWPQHIEPLSSNSDEDELVADETTGQLATSVRRALAEGILSQLGAAHRRLVEMVVYEGLSPSQIATQLGFQPKSVRLNLKNALRHLCHKGLTSHAATDREIADATAPQKPAADRERQREANRKRDHAKRGAQVVSQLDAVAGEEAFAVALARLDEDTQVVVKAIIERSFTVDEAVELLGGDRKAVVKRLKNVAAMGRNGAKAATVDRGELIAR